MPRELTMRPVALGWFHTLGALMFVTWTVWGDIGPSTLDGAAEGLTNFVYVSVQVTAGQRYRAGQPWRGGSVDTVECLGSAFVGAAAAVAARCC